MFASCQQDYAKVGIATFPIGPVKKPLITNYAKVGLNASAALRTKFPEAPGVGFIAGRRSRLVLADVDSKRDRDLHAAIDAHGETPIIVRTGSGGFHLWYRWTGESRSIRPDPARPVDILGSGIVIAPASRIGRASYRFVHGGLEDVNALPAMRHHGPGAPAARTISKGRRNVTLFSHCLRHAGHCDALDDLLDVAHTFNADCEPPMHEAEVAKTAASAWRYEQEGRNFAGRGRAIFTSHAEFDRLSMRAHHLLSLLRRHHWGRPEFALATRPLASKLGWHDDTLRAARDELVNMGLITCIYAGGRGRSDPPIYEWGPAQTLSDAP